MQVTTSTKILDLIAYKDYIGEESIKELKKGAERKYGSPWGLTLGQFFTCSEGDFSHIGIDLKNPTDITALQFYWMESFKDMADNLVKTLERLSVPQSPDAKKASAACLPMTFKESVLVFCREYFGLPNFKAVDVLTIDDILLAKKDAYNNAIFEKGMADIQNQKLKNK